MASDDHVADAARVLGRLGGKALAHHHPGIHREIGRKGGVTTAQRYPGMAKIWGKHGGRRRKPTLDEMEKGCPVEGGDPPAGASACHIQDERQ
jgi:general stress protein YciG